MHQRLAHAPDPERTSDWRRALAETRASENTPRKTAPGEGLARPHLDDRSTAPPDGRSTWNTHRGPVTRRSVRPWPVRAALARLMRNPRATWGTHHAPVGPAHAPGMGRHVPRGTRPLRPGRLPSPSVFPEPTTEASGQNSRIHPPPGPPPSAPMDSPHVPVSGDTFHVEHGRADRLRSASPDALPEPMAEARTELVGLSFRLGPASRPEGFAREPGSGDVFHVEQEPPALHLRSEHAPELAARASTQNWLKHVPRGTRPLAQPLVRGIGRHVPRGTGMRGFHHRQHPPPADRVGCPIALARTVPRGTRTVRHGSTTRRCPPVPDRGARPDDRDWAAPSPAADWLEADSPAHVPRGTSPAARATLIPCQGRAAPPVLNDRGGQSPGTFHVEHIPVEGVPHPSPRNARLPTRNQAALPLPAKGRGTNLPGLFHVEHRPEGRGASSTRVALCQGWSRPPPPTRGRGETPPRHVSRGTRSGGASRPPHRHSHFPLPGIEPPSPAPGCSADHSGTFHVEHAPAGGLPSSRHDSPPGGKRASPSVADAGVEAKNLPVTFHVEHTGSDPGSVPPRSSVSRPQASAHATRGARNVPRVNASRAFRALPAAPPPGRG